METIKVTSNESAKTFTIRIICENGLKLKYRTYPESRERFNEMLYNGINDWKNFLKTNHYYTVSKSW